MYKLNTKGSITVEAAMIVPVVIITVTLVIYIVLIICQTSIMQIMANSIAEHAAGSISKNSGNFYSGKISKSEISSLGLYRRWDSNTIQGNDFEAAAMVSFQRNSVLKNKSSFVDIMHSNNIINRTVTVTLSSDYENPLGALTSIWGGNRKISLVVKAEATIDDPAEFIRNSDFILETASKVPLIREFQGKWQDIIHRMMEYIKKFSKEYGVSNG